MFQRLLTGFWYLCSAFTLTAVSKVLLNVRYRHLTHSQFHACLVLYDSDLGDTMIVVTSGFSFKNFPLQHHLTVRSCILGCRCFLGLDVLSVALVFCHLSKYQTFYYYYIYLLFLDLLSFSIIDSLGNV